MAHKVKGKRVSKIVYDWQDNYDESKLTQQERLKLSVIEVNNMYREGLEESPLSDNEYDYLFNLIEDEEFKEAVGTGLGEDFIPEYLKDEDISNRSE